jgi:hypothetical protein
VVGRLEGVDAAEFHPIADEATGSLVMSNMAQEATNRGN